jgi:hypothetical protein
MSEVGVFAKIANSGQPIAIAGAQRREKIHLRMEANDFHHGLFT